MIAVHPNSAVRALNEALDRILEEGSKEIRASDIAKRALADNPTLESGSEQLCRQAGDVMRARFDFGALRREAATCKDPKRLREIGEIFNAAADALERG